MFPKEQIKLGRMLAAYHDAFRAERVARSGVKFDQLKKTNSGQPIFSVEDVKAEQIVTTFVFDLGLLRSYGRDAKGKRPAHGLSREQKHLLLSLAFWKVRELLTRTFSYRSGCKLRAQKITVLLDESSEAVADELPGVDMAAAIRSAGFAEPAVTKVHYPRSKLYKLQGDGDVATGSEAPGDDDTEDAGGED